MNSLLRTVHKRHGDHYVTDDWSFISLGPDLLLISPWKKQARAWLQDCSVACQVLDKVRCCNDGGNLSRRLSRVLHPCWFNASGCVGLSYRGSTKHICHRTQGRTHWAGQTTKL